MVRYIKENNKKIKQPEIVAVENLSLEQYKRFKKYIPLINNDSYYKDWWLYERGPYATVFGESGNINKHVDPYDNAGVRPVLVINYLKSINLGIGDKFEFGGHSFTVISTNRAICDDFINKCILKSSISREIIINSVVENWFNNAIKKSPEFLNSDNIQFMIKNNDDPALKAYLLDINHKLGFDKNYADRMQKEIDDLFDF